MVDPAGAAPHRATRLDVDPDLRPGETLLRLVNVVLDVDELERFQRTFGATAGTLRAALLEAANDRGGLPPSLAASVLVGQVAAVVEDAAAPSRWSVGDRLACPPPATAIPLWVGNASSWDGQDRVVPVEGHAVLGPGAPVVPIDASVPAVVAAELAAAAHVPQAVARAVGPASRVTVVGATTTAGAAAVMAAAEGGAQVAALVATLQEARLASSLGAHRVAVGDLTSGPEAAQLLAELGIPVADVTVVGVGLGAAAATAAWLTDDDGTVLCPEPVDPADAVAVASTFSTRQRVITVGRGIAKTDRRLAAWFADVPALRELVHWRAGVGPLPAAGSPDDR